MKRELNAKQQEYLNYFSRPQSEIDKTMENIRLKSKKISRMKTISTISSVARVVGVLLIVTIGLGLAEGPAMDIVQIALNN